MIKYIYNFVRYYDECQVLQDGDIEDFHKIFKTLDEKLKFKMEIESNSISFLDLKLFVQKNHLETKKKCL